MDRELAEEFVKGLEAKQKFISSKFFYDDQGSKIFQEIMAMPEYYLTESEYEIFSQQAEQIFKSLNYTEHFNIVELGPGDGVKTFKLLEYLISRDVDFSYVPIDISKGAINFLVSDFSKKLPDLKIRPMIGDYFDLLKNNKEHSNSPNLVLFLGSNIGNYTNSHAIELLSLFRVNMKKGDKILIGMDLRKNPLLINEAYYDKYGITRRFNLNLISRINNDLGGDANIKNFEFYCFYEPQRGEVNSFIVSLENQDVHLSKFNKTIKFQKDELIWTEVSKKYNFEEIEQLSKDSKFRLVKNFLDSKIYFTDSLWELV